jgi:hypothetical protein
MTKFTVMLARMTLTGAAVMKSKKAKTKKHKSGMLAVKPSKGLERDNKGRPIPMKKRLPQDRAKAKKASRKTARRGK